MKRILFITAITLLNTAYSQTKKPAFKALTKNLLTLNNSVTQKQSQLLFRKTKDFPNNTQIAIAFIHKGEVSYYGIKKSNDTICNHNNKKSVFEIGSISKVFTATLLANFTTEGKLKLDDPINNYLKIPFNNNTQITFKELANHTSGLPRLPSNLDLTKVDLSNPYKEYGKIALTTYLTKHLVLSKKGIFQYSNLGAGLLGYTLSQLANLSYENLLQQKIFSKYGMENSTAKLQNTKGNLVKGLNNNGEEIPNWEFTSLAGAGAILSTVEDLSKFATAQFDSSNKELQLTHVKTTTVNPNMDLGLGWHILKSPSKNTWYWHNGGTGGYTSSMVIDTTTKNGIIILSNLSAFHPNKGNIDELCFALMRTLEEE